ncbi:hypothetical protein [Photobacterium lutimaris]|uniref:Uncharacterized protein n=1 Tax=Photobacterium lutimaris TaxID=388278 RepID=A0A2T3J4K9_9GAMM|nr:hypothetical protein [Photobacterium lutimaris]PSU36216.1 hypothetical protein C9I99_04235 [Photobacterium lutimaris]TDR74912.1 hypothetical protein DFP78_106243 [Photobacterium lutimaris]
MKKSRNQVERKSKRQIDQYLPITIRIHYTEDEEDTNGFYRDHTLDVGIEIDTVLTTFMHLGKKRLLQLIKGDSNRIGIFEVVQRTIEMELPEPTQPNTSALSLF